MTGTNFLIRPEFILEHYGATILESILVEDHRPTSLAVPPDPFDQVLLLPVRPGLNKILRKSYFHAAPFKIIRFPQKTFRLLSSCEFSNDSKRTEESDLLRPTSWLPQNHPIFSVFSLETEVVNNSHCSFIALAAIQYSCLTSGPGPMGWICILLTLVICEINVIVYSLD